MMASQRTDRLIAALDRNVSAMFEWPGAGNEVSHRFSRSVIEELEETQKERLELARRWANSPADAVGVGRMALTTWRRQQERRLGLGRAFVADLRDETRRLARRLTNDGDEGRQVRSDDQPMRGGTRDTNDASGQHDVAPKRRRSTRRQEVE